MENYINQLSLSEILFLPLYYYVLIVLWYVKNLFHSFSVGNESEAQIQLKQVKAYGTKKHIYKELA